MDKLLVLYTEYAPYVHACLLKFSYLYDYEVHVVRYPLVKDAPFDFQEDARIKFYDRKQFNKNDLNDLYERLNPVCVLVAGWIDRDYNSVVSGIKKNGKMVIGVVDNHWIGSFKQRVFSTLGRFFMQKHYTNLWVPGTSQYEYMRRLGVPAEKIMLGYYSADSDLYLSRYQKLRVIPKRFIYVGRLIDAKGIPILLKAIEKTNQDGKGDWQFLIVGKGEYEETVKDFCLRHSNVSYRSFMQPEELFKEVADGGVFILPSNFEPWGVVVHEFALMGFPLILSSVVGSMHYFLTPGYNGYIFQAGNYDSLVYTIKKVMGLPPADLVKMSERSHQIGQTLNTDAWSGRLHESIKTFYFKSDACAV